MAPPRYRPRRSSVSVIPVTQPRGCGSGAGLVESGPARCNLSSQAVCSTEERGGSRDTGGCVWGGLEAVLTARTPVRGYFNDP
jgi:hypothetical protein